MVGVCGVKWEWMKRDQGRLGPMLSPPQSISGRDGCAHVRQCPRAGAGAVAVGLLLDPCLSHSVVSVKPKAHSRQSRMNCYVEVAGDGLPSETKKTGKQMGSSELLWNEILIL